MKYVKLKDLCTIIMGQSPSSSSYNLISVGVPFLQGNADFGRRHPLERTWCTEPKKITEKGDILFSVRAPIGAINISDKKYCIGRGLSAIRPDISKVNMDYVYWFLRANKNNFVNKGTGSTFKAIGKNVLEDFLVPIIDINEQEKIANTLTLISELMYSRKQQLDKFDLLVKAKFVEMFGDPYLNDKNWEQSKLKDVCDSIVRGPFGSSLKKDFFVKKDLGSYKVYEQKHAINKDVSLGEYYINGDKYNELIRFKVEPGDFIMSCSGTIGELYRIPEGAEEGIINQALCKFTLSDKILPICFISYMSNMIDRLEKKGSGIKNLGSVSYIKNMPINVPPVKLQKDFENFYYEVATLKDEVKASIKKTHVLFDSLIQNYFKEH